MSGPLAGQIALVTGGADGIGRAIAAALASEGARVVIADRSPPEKIAEAVRTIEAAGGEALGHTVDVSSEDAVLGLFAEIGRRFGRLDVLVNNAGILVEKPLLETTLADFDRVIGVNLRGAFIVGREALRLMTKQKSGRVINIASELAYLGRADLSVYCASKGGIISMTRAWAREFAPAILVNAIAPGPTATAMLGPETMSPEMLASETRIPLGRIAEPAEIAAAAVFLSGPGATFMTGQCISPNGGAVML